MDLKNIQYVYVATDTARQATTALDKSSATYIADGEIVVTDLAGNVLDTDAASYTKEKVKIVFRKGDTILSSPAISYKNIKKYLVKPYAAAVKQVSYLGYNGSTGSLEGGTLVAGNDYIVTLRKLTVVGNMTDAYYDNKSVQWYNETATSGQVTLADGLIAQMITNFNSDFQIDNYVIFERICSNDGTAITGTGTIKVTNGSKTIVAGTDINAVMAVGDYIRISGTGVTTPMYKIASMDTVANTAMLDVPYQGTSATVAEASCEYVSAANAANAATNWGIKMTANDRTFEAGRWRYDQFKFIVTLTNFNTTTVTDSVAAFVGSGTYGEVAEKEWYAYANDALPFAEYNMPPRVKTLKAVSGKTYDYIIIAAYDNDHSNIHTRPESPFEIIIAMPVGCTQGDAAGSATVAMGVATALDTWLTTMTGVTYNEDSKLT